jgi:hypothetical protein
VFSYCDTGNPDYAVTRFDQRNPPAIIGRNPTIDEDVLKLSSAS